MSRRHGLAGWQAGSWRAVERDQMGGRQWIGDAGDTAVSWTAIRVAVIARDSLLLRRIGAGEE